MESFTPFSALMGGALIGLGAAVLYLGVGRIAGVSGIVAGLADRGNNAIPLSFVAGLIIAATVMYEGLGLPRAVEPQTDWPWLIGAGLLVGFGTRLGNGCTSGHGVCGIARLSPRSIVATAVFFTVAATTVFVVRHVVGG